MNTHSSPRKTPGRPSEGAGDKREAILSAALTLFASQGAAATSLPEIGRAAHVTPAMVHYYFGGRSGLIDALMEERILPGIRELWQSLDKHCLDDPRAFLVSILDRVLAKVDSIPVLPQLWVREILTDGGVLRVHLLAHLRAEHMQPKIIEAVRNAQRKKLISSGICPGLFIPSVVGAIMLPLAASGLLRELPWNQDFTRAELRRHILTLLLHGLLPDQTR